MHRLGVPSGRSGKRFISGCVNAKRTAAGEYHRHFSRADEDDAQPTEAQITRFMAFAADKPGKNRFPRPAVFFTGRRHTSTWFVRGSFCTAYRRKVAPKPGDFGLKPVMTLKSRLIAVRKHKAGEAVGYGGTWVSDRDTCLG